MNNVKSPICVFIVAVTAGLAGCATQDRTPARDSPVQVSESIRWQIDRDISATSLAATGLAGDYVREAMEKWKDRVRRRTEADFIPWFTSYWTQEWLAVKVAWYKLKANENSATAMERLTAYLQQQYHDRVLYQVAREIDLNEVREQATKIYVRVLSEQLQEGKRHDGVPRNQFDQRLKEIAAIEPAPGASLYQLVHAEPIASLPAYEAMLIQIRKDARATESVLLEAGISHVANRTGDMLTDKLALSGGASAAAAAFGGIPGIMVSVGAAGFEAAAHENRRPELEARLRENLNAALDEMCRSLMDDPATGVMAGIYTISGQIEQSLVETVALPVNLEPAPTEAPLPGR